MYLTLQQSIKLLTTECQKGQTSHQERALYLFFQKGGGALCPSAPCHRVNTYRGLSSQQKCKAFV